MPLPSPVTDLIERFSRNLETYTADSYNETQLRREFLDPLFQSLGWDMINTAGYADAYKDVIHEDSLKIPGASGGTKAPDYCFRIGGTRKFFLEAKKPSLDIKSNSEPAYQLRRYAWSAKLPISVLSDFEEFAIYDTRIKPNVNDKASTARIFYCRYTDYADKWDEIAAILSKDSILKGAFDKYAESNRSKRGTAQVDDAFLEEIEKWRDQLATNIALRNSDISERDLNVAVTKTIDRIVFLRICEDRGVEIYGQLQTITQTNDIYGELLKLFRRADEKYNSGLFHFSKEADRPEEPDTLTPSLEIDDKSLRPILDSLYYPESPYVFSVLPADILGHVYEQFLGKVIRLTPGHRAKVEEKPEVRKAGGVYYTPTYIVNYIVENTVGKLLEGKTPKEAAKLKILDPACGSGSFLLGAYQYLLDWHLHHYASNNPEQFLKQKNPPIYQTTAISENIAPGLPGVPASPTSSFAYKLTTNGEKRILTSCIYGVDIDQNAVETTKLSLLLKVLEGESKESLANQMKFFRERTLPDLANNIKCGNSLIATDFFSGQQTSLLGDEELLYKINAFDWKGGGGFSTILHRGGFDAVIGNPPYVLLQSLQDKRGFNYLAQSFRVAKYKIDTFHLFFELAARLARHGGYFGYITPNTFLRNQHAIELRRLLLENSQLQHIRLFEYSVFKGASVDTCITVARRCAHGCVSSNVEVSRSNAPESVMSEKKAIPQNFFASHQKLEFNTSGETGATVIDKMKSHSFPLGEIATAYFGIQTFDRTKYVQQEKIRASFVPVIDGVNILRYQLRPSTDYLDFKPRNIKSGGKETVYQRERIGVRQIGRTPIGTIIPQGLFTLNTIYNIYIIKPTKYRLPFMLGVLSSKANSFFWQNLFFDQKKTFPKIKKPDLLSIPIPKIDFEKRASVTTHDLVVTLVNAMLSLHQQLAKAKTGREQIQRQIAATDQQIDALVYELYELTPEEIQLVESATAPRPEPPAPADPT